MHFRFETTSPNIPVVECWTEGFPVSVLDALKKGEDRTGVSSEVVRLSDARRAKKLPVYVGPKGVSFGEPDPWIFDLTDEAEEIEYSRVVDACIAQNPPRTRYPLARAKEARHGGGRMVDVSNFYTQIGLSTFFEGYPKAPQHAGDMARQWMARWCERVLGRTPDSVVYTADSPRGRMNHYSGKVYISAPYYVMTDSGTPDCGWCHAFFPASAIPGISAIHLSTNYPYHTSLGDGKDPRTWDLEIIGVAGNKHAVDRLADRIGKPTFDSEYLPGWGDNSRVATLRLPDHPMFVERKFALPDPWVPYSSGWVTKASVLGLPEWISSFHFFCDVTKDHIKGEVIKLHGATYRIDWSSVALSNLSSRESTEGEGMDHLKDTFSLYQVSSYVPHGPYRASLPIIEAMKLHEACKKGGVSLADQLLVESDDPAKKVTFLQAEAAALQLSLPIVHRLRSRLVGVGEVLVLYHKDGQWYMDQQATHPIPLSRRELVSAWFAGTLLLEADGSPYELSFDEAELRFPPAPVPTDDTDVELREGEYWLKGPLDPGRLSPGKRAGFWLLQAVHNRQELSKLLVTAQVTGQTARRVAS